MFYNARYYSPYLNRWLQPDVIVPDGEKASIIPLTVSYHELPLLAQLNAENAFTLRHGHWPQLSTAEKREAKINRGPLNPQQLNRYSYVLNNPLRYMDPSGHVAACTNNYSDCTGAIVINNSTHTILVRGDWLDENGVLHENAIIRLHAGQSSRIWGMVDVDEIMIDQDPIDGHTNSDWLDLNDGETVEITNNTAGEATIENKYWWDWSESGAGQGYVVMQDSVVRSQSADLTAIRFVNGRVGAWWARSWSGTMIDCTGAGNCIYTPPPLPYDKE